MLSDNELIALVDTVCKSAQEMYESACQQAERIEKMCASSNRLCVSEETGEVLGRCNNCNVSL